MRCFLAPATMLASVILLTSFFPTVYGGFSLSENCRVFCEGPLLEAVQNSQLFHDSKDFVDMPLINSPMDTLRAFEELENQSDSNSLRTFIDQHFLSPGTELQQCEPVDWIPYPASFRKIKDPNYRQWAYDVHAKWKSLCRRVRDDVKKHPNLYSLVTVPYPFIAPGGRFREFYYWDTYWIVKGLLASEMITTARHMIRNLGYMVQRFGFVPNGGRVYYLKRTQPPLLPGCVLEYFLATNDLEFVREMLPLLDKEYRYWQARRSVVWKTPLGKEYPLFHYRVHQDRPRPESYKEDIMSTSHLKEGYEKVRMWSEIAAACESGWDFSSRWFSRDGPYQNSLRGIRTSRIIPVDLNAFMCWNFDILSNFHTAVGNTSTALMYRELFNGMKDAFANAFWDEDDGIWYDLDLDTNDVSRRFYASNPTPLFTECVHDAESVRRRVLNYLKITNSLNFPGGFPTAFTFSGEQWDSPNGWAPTNHVVIEALRRSNNQDAQDAALKLADKWLETNYIAYARSGGKMFEKYNVEALRHTAGGGGEYEVQEGFGWTNGVVLDLLLKYGDRLKAPLVPPSVLMKP